ncbi:tyrosine-type recombinase/integrase [Georgenia sp. SUBG003]|uniref:tyrosine-type recombinase/integrase n=1 Tax=Georgenia sp. SUBG003 TaxID=1497974 RepID=UPI003AB774B4
MNERDVEHIDYFVTHRRLSESTRRLYRHHVSALAAWCGSEGLNLTSVSSASLARYIRIERQRLAISTVRSRFDCLRLFFAWMVEQGARADNPAAKLDVEIPQRPIRQALTAEQIGLLWRAARRPGERVIVGLLGICALRPEEVCGAEVSHLGELDGRRILHIPTRGRSQPYTVLPDEVYSAIKEHLEGRDRGALVVTGSGGKAHRKHLYVVVRRLGELAGIPFSVSPRLLSYSMRAVAVERGFSFFERYSGRR